VDRRLADARKAGMTEEELDAAVDVIAAVDARCTAVFKSAD
jgi:hypothetical protein